MRAKTDRSLFGIVVYETVEPIDVGGTYGVLSMARRLLPNLRMLIVAERPGPVLLASGLEITAHHGFVDCPPLDVAIVCGGSAWPTEGKNPAMLAFLSRASRECEILASVCTGGMILGAAGLLDGGVATTRRRTVGDETRSPLERLAASAPGVSCTSAAVVDSGRIVTGGGVAFAIDTTLHLITRLYGPAASEEVASAIEYTHALAANRAAMAATPPEPGPPPFDARERRGPTAARTSGQDEQTA